MNQTGKTLIFALIISLISLYTLQSYKIINQTVSSSDQVLGDTTIKSVPCDVINTWQKQYCSVTLITPIPTPSAIPSVYPTLLPTRIPTCSPSGGKCYYELPCCNLTDKCINGICISSVIVVTPTPTPSAYPTTRIASPTPTKVIYNY